MLRGSLDRIRVIDFSQIGAGPTCTMFLGDLGADVIKVESPSGDVGRALGPPWTADRQSAVFVAFNRNKRSITLDLKSDEGLAVARDLIRSADIVVESFRPGVMDRLGLGYEACRLLRADLIYCSVSAYGSTGPGARMGGVDGIVQAASGLMSLIGEQGDRPSKVQAPVVDVTTGHLATVAVLAQLFKRERTGEGGHLDVSMMAAALSLQQSSLVGFLCDGALPERAGSAAPYSAPNEAFAAADGWIMIAAYQNGRWERLCSVLGRQDLREDPRFLTSSLRVEHRAAMREALAPVFQERSCADWLEALGQADILCAKVADYNDLMGNELFAHLQMLVTPAPGQAHAQGEGQGASIRFPGFPVNTQENQLLPHRAPPQHGEHGEEILKELGYRAADIERIGRSTVATPPIR